MNIKNITISLLILMSKCYGTLQSLDLSTLDKAAFGRLQDALVNSLIKVPTILMSEDDLLRSTSDEGSDEDEDTATDFYGQFLANIEMSQECERVVIRKNIIETTTITRGMQSLCAYLESRALGMSKDVVICDTEYQMYSPERKMTEISGIIVSIRIDERSRKRIFLQHFNYCFQTDLQRKLFQKFIHQLNDRYIVMAHNAGSDHSTMLRMLTDAGHRLHSDDDARLSLISPAGVIIRRRHYICTLKLSRRSEKRKSAIKSGNPYEIDSPMRPSVRQELSSSRGVSRTSSSQSPSTSVDSSTTSPVRSARKARKHTRADGVTYPLYAYTISVRGTIRCTFRENKLLNGKILEKIRARTLHLTERELELFHRINPTTIDEFIEMQSLYEKLLDAIGYKKHQSQSLDALRNLYRIDSADRALSAYSEFTGVPQRQIIKVLADANYNSALASTRFDAHSALFDSVTLMMIIGEKVKVSAQLKDPRISIESKQALLKRVKLERMRKIAVRVLAYYTRQQAAVPRPFST